jgi:HAMP domain-containing protein
MPGVPGTGTLADYTVYFWALLTVALCLLVIGITYIRRTIKIEEHGK